MKSFAKMHGAGNDFIIVDNRQNDIINPSQMAVKVCDRHFGVGADGFMLVELSKISDIKMAFYNSDGREATMCGNGIRCFAKFVYDEGIVKKESFHVETGDGIKQISIVQSEETESIVKVDMGKWTFSALTINQNGEEVINKKIAVGDDTIEISCVHMGVPHGVIFVDEIDENKTIRYGSIIEKNSSFPQGINVNFSKVINQQSMHVDTWERGAGKTLACGTGVCSSVIVANRLGKVGQEVVVNVAGGQLKINLINEDKITMEGKAVTICKGMLYL